MFTICFNRSSQLLTPSLFLVSSNILKKRVKTAFDENDHEAKDVEIHTETIQKELMTNLGMWDIIYNLKTFEIKFIMAINKKN